MNLEIERGAARDDAARALGAVPQLGGDDHAALAADLHRQESQSVERTRSSALKQICNALL